MSAVSCSGEAGSPEPADVAFGKEMPCWSDQASSEEGSNGDAGTITRAENIAAWARFAYDGRSCRATARGCPGAGARAGSADPHSGAVAARGGPTSWPPT